MFLPATAGCFYSLGSSASGTKCNSIPECGGCLPLPSSLSKPMSLTPHRDQDDYDVPSSTNSFSLLDMTVKSARLLIAGRLARSRNIPGFSATGSALPRIWRTVSTAVNDTVVSASTPDALLRTLGLEGLEERWRRDLHDDNDDDTWPESDIDQVPAWIDLASPRDTTARATRAANRSTAATEALATTATATTITASAGDVATAGSSPTFPMVWRRLRDPTLPRPFRSTCWALLHGVIGVNAFIYHTHQQPNRLRPDPATRLCTNPACLATGIHENISHAFLDCPAAAPVIDWLLQTWQQLSNAPAPPPRTAAVLLADDIEAWPIAHRPSGPALDLWTRLRVCVLGSIWQVRCHRKDSATRHESFARRAVSIAVESIIEAIQRDWQRTQGDIRQLDNCSFCSSWWRGRDTELTLRAFNRVWVSPPYFCDVTGPRNIKKLELFIGVDVQR